jgi:hypothetical protein
MIGGNPPEYQVLEEPEQDVRDESLEEESVSGGRNQVILLGLAQSASVQTQESCRPT